MTRTEFEAHKQAVLSIVKAAQIDHEHTSVVSVSKFTALFDQCRILLELVKELGNVPDA